MPKEKAVLDIKPAQQKDKVAKKLEDYPEVFADILNVLLFGMDVIDPAQLHDGPTESIYKAETGELKEQRRDTIKYLHDVDIVIAEFGFENQAKVDDIMPVRVLGYDYSSYRRQVDNGKNMNIKPQLRPVVTIVLNFSDKPWTGPKSLKEMFLIPKHMEPFIQDYKIHVFDIAYLDNETVNQFKSTFKHVAHFLVNNRIYGDEYEGSNEEIEHLPEFLDFLRVFTGDERFAEIAEDLVLKKEEGGVVTMCGVLDYRWNKGVAEGKSQIILSIYRKGMSITEIADLVDMTEQQVQEIINASLKTD